MALSLLFKMCEESIRRRFRVTVICQFVDCANRNMFHCRNLCWIVGCSTLTSLKWSKNNKNNMDSVRISRQLEQSLQYSHRNWNKTCLCSCGEHSTWTYLSTKKLVFCAYVRFKWEFWFREVTSNMAKSAFRRFSMIVCEWQTGLGRFVILLSVSLV